MKKEIHTAKGLWIVEKLNNIAFVEFTSKKLTSMTKWVIVDGQIVNLAFEVDLYIDKEYPQTQIMTGVIAKIGEYMDINKHHMGENIYLGQLIETVNNVAGVINVIDLRIFNKVGLGKYSMNEIQQPYLNESTKQIDLTSDYTLFGSPNSMFEVKYNEKDIIVRVK